MIVEFEKVRWKNFMSTGQGFNEIVLNKNHTTLLMGESGSGKSTLLDAIAFALFDKPFRAVNKDTIVNWLNDKDCLVELEFKIGNKKYFVRRGRKPNIFEIYVDGVMLSQDAANKDYQKHFEKNILKFNFKSFAQIVVLGASNFTPFMQLKAQHRREIIENLLDIEVFSIMNELLKSEISNLKDEMKDNLAKIENTKKTIQIREQMIVVLQTDNEHKIEENKALILKNQESIQKLEEQMGILNQAVQAQLELLALENDINSQMKDMLDLEKKIEQNLKGAQKAVDFYTKHDNCPTCQQGIAHDFKENEIETKTKKIVEYNEGLKSIEEKVTKLSLKQQEFKKIKDKAESLRAEIRKLESNKVAIEAYNKKVERENNELQKPHANIEDEKKTIRELTEQVKQYESDQNTFLFEKNLNELAANLLKDGGVKAQIIKQYLPIINQKINQHLQEMNFFMTFNMDENFNESIKSRGRDDASYANFSEGEKQRIDLALLFTWRSVAKMKNSINTNLLVLDEVFDSHLDNLATENVLQLLNSKMLKDTNIFVISHKETIADKFEATIKFTKKKNFSIIEP